MVMNLFAPFLVLSSTLLFQAAAPVPLPVDGCLTPSEKSQLEREVKIDNRINLYRNASTRCLGSFMHAMARHDLQFVDGHLSSWLAFLGASLKDVEANVGRKKRSRALIRYEIHLRKAIVDVRGAKLKATVEHEKAFDSWLAEAEEIRKKFVHILFPR